MLTRRGAPFDGWAAAEALPGGLDGLTLVYEDDDLVGYAAWQRGQGYDPAAVLGVQDLLAVHAEAARELVGVLSSWQSVTPTVRLRLLGDDAVAGQLPLERARVHRQQLWMHRPVDVRRAIADRGWPPYVHGRVDLSIADPIADWNAGPWRLEVADGAARLHRIVGEPDLRLDVRGFALLYTGAAQADAVAGAGLLRCGGGRHPGELDLLGAGRPAQLLDYF